MSPDKLAMESVRWYETMSYKTTYSQNDNRSLGKNTCGDGERKNTITGYFLLGFDKNSEENAVCVRNGTLDLSYVKTFDSENDTITEIRDENGMKFIITSVNPVEGVSQKFYEDHKYYCENLNYANQKDWKMLTRYQLTIVSHYLRTKKLSLTGTLLAEETALERAKRFKFIKEECIAMSERLRNSPMKLPPYPVNRCVLSRVHESDGENDFDYDDFVRVLEVSEKPEHADKVVSLFYMDTMNMQLELQKKPFTADIVCAKEVK